MNDIGMMSYSIFLYLYMLISIATMKQAIG